MRSATAALTLAAVLVFGSTSSAQVHAGAHYSALALEYPEQTRSGAGAFVVYSPREWIGIDVGTSVFLSEEIGGVAWQLLAGPRVGTEIAGLRIYAKVRPGLMRFSQRFYSPEIVCIAIFPPPDGCLVSNTNVALDVGGTVETDISPRTLLRFDLGDTLTRYRRGEGEGFGAVWKHGLQFNAGIGWRF